MFSIPGNISFKSDQNSSAYSDSLKDYSDNVFNAGSINKGLNLPEISIIAIVFLIALKMVVK